MRLFGIAGGVQLALRVFDNDGCLFGRSHSVRNQCPRLGNDFHVLDHRDLFQSNLFAERGFKKTPHCGVEVLAIHFGGLQQGHTFMIRIVAGGKADDLPRDVHYESRITERWRVVGFVKAIGLSWNVGSADPAADGLVPVICRRGRQKFLGERGFE